MPQLFSEFDMSPYLQEVTPTTPWYLLMHLRFAWNEVYRDKRLSDWEHKGNIKAICHHYNLPTAQVYHQFHADTFSEASLRQVCDELGATRHGFVIKPCHFTAGQGVYLYQQGHFEAALAFHPGSNKLATRAMRLGIKSLAHKLHSVLAAHPSSRKAWSQRQCQAGLLIEALGKVEANIHVITIWGELVGASLGNTQVYIGADGVPFGDKASNWHWLSDVWPSVMKISEKLARGTDMLHINIFANREGAIWINSIHCFTWPLSHSFTPFVSIMSEDFVSGYQNKSIRLVERSFARLH